MKKIKRVSLMILLALSWLSACVNTSEVSNSTDDDQNCLEEPKKSVSDAEDLVMENDSIGISDRVSFGRDKGYTFKGKAGNRLSYETDANVCIWLYTPQSEIMKGNDLSDLPEDGKYLVQVAALQGTTTFDLELSLDDNSIEVAESNPSKVEQQNSEQQNFEQIDITPPKSQQPPSQTNPSSQSQQNSRNNDDFNQEKAVQLIVSWLNAKPKIFASPFDRGLVGKLTTGILYEDITKPGGSIDWLRSNNSYYEYHEASIKNVSNFSTDDSTASMKVDIYENRTLYGKTGKADQNQSGASTKSYTYFFEKRDGTWKISDYK